MCRFRPALEVAQQLLKLEPTHPQVLEHIDFLEELAESSSSSEAGSDSSSSSEDDEPRLEYVNRGAGAGEDARVATEDRRASATQNNPQDGGEGSSPGPALSQLRQLE